MQKHFWEMNIWDICCFSLISARHVDALLSSKDSTACIAGRMESTNFRRSISLNYLNGFVELEGTGCLKLAAATEAVDLLPLFSLPLNLERERCIHLTYDHVCVDQVEACPNSGVEK